jgi:magnesium chelatase family protein
LLNDALTRLQFSTRACFRILKIARSIADLAEADVVSNTHLWEALSYRRLNVG